MTDSFQQYISDKMREVRGAMQERRIGTYLRSADRPLVYIDEQGRELLSFCSNDYFGLACHRDVIHAARSAAGEYGAGASSSALISGAGELYGQLCSALAEYKGAGSCALFPSGYQASIGTIPTLISEGDLALVDRLAHNCFFAGLRLSGARILPFRHNDTHHLRHLLERYRGRYRNCLILTETVFSMDGDVAPVGDISSIAREHDCWVMSDDAHGIGLDIDRKPEAGVPHIEMGTLSKALGAQGGYVCGDEALGALLANFSPSLIYSTAAPPPTIAAALAGLRILRDSNDLQRKLERNISLFASEMEMEERPQTPIIPRIIGSNDNTLAVAEHLREAGFLVTAIRPPTVPRGSARLRITLSALHNVEDIKKFTGALKESERHL